MAKKRSERLRVGLALGGGMARGCAHVGVLRLLERHRVPIDLIAGTSVGSLIGGAYAAGLSPGEIEKLALTVRWSDLGRIRLSKLGLNDNSRTEDYVRATFPVTNFEETRLPFGAVATDIQNGRMVVFTEGSIPLAIRASCALPVFYAPVMVNGRMMVDGGLVGHIPASVARMMGADVVIAVDINSQLPIPQPTHMMAILSQSFTIMGRSSVSYIYTDADVIIRPRIEHIRPDDLSRAAEMIAAGEVAAERVLPRIMKLLSGRRKGWLGRLLAGGGHDRHRISPLD